MFLFTMSRNKFFFFPTERHVARQFDDFHRVEIELSRCFSRRKRHVRAVPTFSPTFSSKLRHRLTRTRLNRCNQPDNRCNQRSLCNPLVSGWPRKVFVTTLETLETDVIASKREQNARESERSTTTFAKRRLHYRRLEKFA